VVSDRFGIPFGEIRGKWDPTITTEEFERGIEILKKHDSEKSRKRRHFYLLRNLLYIKENGKNYKMYGSTPSGRSQSYAYYITHAKPKGKKLHIPCEKVEAELPRWLAGISVTPELVPAIQEVYQTQVNRITEDERENKLVKLNSQMKQLRAEEAHLGRLLITGKISEETFDQLREEWQEKVRNIQNNLIIMERESLLQLDDLDTALFLMTKMGVLFDRLEPKDQQTLLQIIANQIIIDASGEIVNQVLHSPFSYLKFLVDNLNQQYYKKCGSDHVQYRPQIH
jgi:hypothetical protein